MKAFLILLMASFALTGKPSVPDSSDVIAAISGLSIPETSTKEIGIKTNALLWSLTIMNAEAEILVHPNIGISLGLAWCPWFLSEKFGVRNLAILPAARWWLSRKHSGHFFGIHAGAAWFNIKAGDFRYQDRSIPLLNFGADYGYHINISGNWGAELMLGVGMASLKYDRFHNISNGALADTRKTLWFGIDRIAISLSYRFRH